MIKPTVWYTIFFTVILFIHPRVQSAELLVLTSKNNEQQLTKERVRQLYLQGEQSNGHIQPVNMEAGARSRTIFNMLVLGLTESRLQSYWSQMRFTGRNKPPIELGSEQAMLSYLQKTPNAIGYIIVNEVTGPALPADLRVLLNISY